MARTRTRTIEKKDTASNNKAVVNSEEQIGKGRPTPKASEVRTRAAGRTGLINRIPIVRGIVGYFRGVWSEMGKVTWPTREETTRLTGVVLGVTIAFALGLGALDTFFGWWFQQAFHADSEDIFLIVGAGVTAVAGSIYYAMRRYA